jgi:vanillate O-demethylase monooxygenase subunit
MDNAPGPGFLDNLNDKCDSWIAYDYLVPGVLMMLSGSWPAGKTRNLGLDVPDLKNEIDDALYLQINIQAVTPVSERSARYYYLASPHRNFLNLLTAKQLVDLNTMAFMEDKVVIEAQQTALDRKPDFKVMPTVHDRGVTSYNRLIGRLIAEEHESEGT